MRGSSVLSTIGGVQGGWEGPGFSHAVDKGD